MRPSFAERVRVWPQYLLPKHTLTQLAWWLSNIRYPPFKNAFIRVFSRLFSVNLEEAESPHPADYSHFNAFFTRALKPGTRPIDTTSLVSPCDGCISQLGRLDGPSHTRLIQAKGLDYTLEELLDRDEGLDAFHGGQWMTIYLAPYDYHRVHVPAPGTLIKATRLPGELFSVSHATARAIPRLFARNERLVCEFAHPQGHYFVVMVAALMVAGIETVWDDPSLRRPLATPINYTGSPMQFQKGDEMGRFHWGSTVIVITPPEFPSWKAGLQASDLIRLGQGLTAN